VNQEVKLAAAEKEKKKAVRAAKARLERVKKSNKKLVLKREPVTEAMVIDNDDDGNIDH
jgi:hypothetical protein